MDLTALLGYGRQLTSTLALELDVGPTFVRGDYSTVGRGDPDLGVSLTAGVLVFF